MKSEVRQYCLRLPSQVYVDVVDLAGMFDLSANEFLLTAVREYVEMQLRQEPARTAIAKLREARQVHQGRRMAAS